MATYILSKKQFKKVVAVTTKRQISQFSLPKDDLFPLLWLVISENGKIIWRFVLTSIINIFRWCCTPDSQENAFKPGAS